MNKILLIVLMGSLSGCAAFSDVTDKVVDAVDEYCTRTTLAERDLIRGNVNNALAEKGHSVRVNCAGDP